MFQYSVRAKGASLPPSSPRSHTHVVEEVCPIHTSCEVYTVWLTALTSWTGKVMLGSWRNVLAYWSCNDHQWRASMHLRLTHAGTSQRTSAMQVRIMRHSLPWKTDCSSNSKQMCHHNINSNSLFLRLCQQLITFDVLKDDRRKC